MNDKDRIQPVALNSANSVSPNAPIVLYISIDDTQYIARFRNVLDTVANKQHLIFVLFCIFLRSFILYTMNNIITILIICVQIYNIYIYFCIVLLQNIIINAYHNIECRKICSRSVPRSSSFESNASGIEFRQN